MIARVPTATIGAWRRRGIALLAASAILAASPVFSQAATREPAEGGPAGIRAAQADGLATARSWAQAAQAIPETNANPDVILPVNPAQLAEARLYDPRDDDVLLGAGSAAGASDGYQVMRAGDAARGTTAPEDLAAIRATGVAINADPHRIATDMASSQVPGSCQELETSTRVEVYAEKTCNTGTRLVPRPESCTVPLEVGTSSRTLYSYIAGANGADGTSGPFTAWSGFSDELAAGSCAVAGTASWCGNLARVGEPVPAGCAADDDLVAYDLRCIGEASGVEPTGAGLASRRDLATGELWYARAEELVAVSALRDEGMCAPLQSNPDCIFETETCTASDPVTRTINGFAITQPCWAWQRNFTCYTRVRTSDCPGLASDPACRFTGRSCLDDSASGPCDVWSDSYRCTVPGGRIDTAIEHVCGGNVYCLNGACQQIEREASNELKDALIALGAMDRAQKEFDPATLSLFGGARQTCHKPVFGLVDCCAGKTSGLLSTASGAAALAGGPAAIAAIATPFLSLFACSNEEKMLDVKDRMGLCVAIGTYCSARTLGICTTRRKAYCCFESKLTRILQEQGRTQLGKPWGRPRSEQCAGFSVDDFARLDLSRMDFSEIYEELLEAARLPDEAGLAAQIQQKIRDYYATHRGGSTP